MALDPENVLVMQLQYGEVLIAMKPESAPNHVKRIKEMVKSGFYDGVVFHRVIDDFMAQTGDPTGTGTGGSGKKLKAEFNDLSHKRGTVSMARAGDPDSADSQFFICFDDCEWLDRKYTVWGEVVSGMEFVDLIKRGEPPRMPDKILSLRLAQEGDKLLPSASSQSSQGGGDNGEVIEI